MALKESYLAKWKDIPKDAKKIAVTRTAKSILAPSVALLEDWKSGKISWSEVETRYRKEILDSPSAVRYMKEIKYMSATEDVYLVCYEKRPPCHRFILTSLIKELD